MLARPEHVALTARPCPAKRSLGSIQDATRPLHEPPNGGASGGLTNIGASNGLLRQYFPKGTDLLAHTAADLAAVAVELNDRPRKTLQWATPAHKIKELLSAH